MKESFEQPNIVPKDTPEMEYLRQGVKVQEALNEALKAARTRKMLVEKKMPGQITREYVQGLKDKYDVEFKKLQELEEKIPEKRAAAFSKLDNLEEWKSALKNVEEDTDTTREFGRRTEEDTEATREFVMKPEEQETKEDRDWEVKEDIEQWRPRAEDEVFTESTAPIVPADPRKDTERWNKMSVDDQMAALDKYNKEKAEFEEWEEKQAA